MRKKMGLDSMSSSTSWEKVSDSPVCLICLKFIRNPGFSTSGSNAANKKTETEPESISVVLDDNQSQSEIIDHDHDQDDVDQNRNLLQKLLSLSKDYLEVPSESIKKLLINQSKSKNQIWDSDIFCGSCIRTVGSTCQFYNELCFLQLQLHRMLRDLNQTLEESTKSKSNMIGKRLHQKLAKQLKLSGKDCASRIQEIRMLLAENCQKKIESQSQLLKDDDDGVPKPETLSPSSSEISNASSSGVELDATATTFNSEDNHSVNEDDIDTNTTMPDDSVSVLPLLLSSSVHSDGNKENDLKVVTPSSDTGVIVRRRPARKRKRVEVEQENEMATPKQMPRSLKRLEPLWSKRPVEMLSRTRSGPGSFSPFDSTLPKMNEIYEMKIEDQDKGQDESHRPLDLRRLRGPIQGIKKPFKCLRCNRGFENIELIKIHEQWCKPSSASASNGNENKIITGSANGKAKATTKARVAIGISSPKEKSSFKTPKGKAKTTTDSETNTDTDVRVIEVVGSDSATLLKPGKKKKGEPRVVMVYRCKVCNKTFPTAINLRTHEFIHSDNKPFVCGKCGLGYAQKNNALKHESKCTEMQKPQRKSQTTSNSSSLNKTPLSLAVAAAHARASLKCGYCGKYFQSRISSRNHQNVCKHKPKKEEKMSKELTLQSESGIRDQDVESESDAPSTGKSSTPDVLSQLDLIKVNHEQEQQTVDITGGTENQQESSNSGENESWFDADTGDDLVDLDLTTTTTADIETNDNTNEEFSPEGDSEQVDEDEDNEEREASSSIPNSGLETSSSSSSFMEVVEDSQTEVNDDSNSPDVLEKFLGEGQISGSGRSSDHDLNDNEENVLEKTEKTIAVTG